MIQAFTKLCKSVHPWESVSEIQYIKETSAAVLSDCAFNFNHSTTSSSFTVGVKLRKTIRVRREKWKKNCQGL